MTPVITRERDENSSLNFLKSQIMYQLDTYCNVLLKYEMCSRALKTESVQYMRYKCDVVQSL